MSTSCGSLELDGTEEEEEKYKYMHLIPFAFGRLFNPLSLIFTFQVYFPQFYTHNYCTVVVYWALSAAKAQEAYIKYRA